MRLRSTACLGRSIFKLLLPLAVFVACNLCQAARAAEVTLTSGSAVINCTGARSRDNGRIELTGQDFHLLFSYDGVFGDIGCSPAPVTINLRTISPPPYDLVISFVTYQGVTSMFTVGSLSFDGTSISGFIEARNTDPNGVVLFTVNFKGSGIGSFSDTKATFDVVPEPITVVLFGTGLAGIAGCYRKRKRTHAGVG
jgi:hypothetical protein